MSESSYHPYRPPLSSLSLRQSEPSLKKTSVLFMILMIFVTLGYYSPYWYLSRRKALNRMMEDTEIPLPLCIAHLLTHTLYLLWPQGVGDLWSLVGGLVQLVNAVLALWLAFSVKSVLDASYPGVYLSGVMTFFFQALYLQYKINRVEKETLLDLDLSSESYEPTRSTTGLSILREESAPRGGRIRSMARPVMILMLGALGLAVLIGPHWYRNQELYRSARASFITQCNGDSQCLKLLERTFPVCYQLARDGTETMPRSAKRQKLSLSKLTQCINQQAGEERFSSDDVRAALLSRGWGSSID